VTVSKPGFSEILNEAVVEQTKKLFLNTYIEKGEVIVAA
jgi:hypothetical protein